MKFKKITYISQISIAMPRGRSECPNFKTISGTASGWLKFNRLIDA